MAADRYPSVPERITWTTGFRCATDKDVLGHLSSFADFRTGKAWRGASVPKIVARCHLPKRTVQRALHRLEADGWVAPRRRHRHATAWDICVDRLAMTFGQLTNLSATGGAQTTAMINLSAMGGAQPVDLSATGGVQTPDLSATGGAPFPCTDPQYEYVPVPAHGAAIPPPQQLPLTMEVTHEALEARRLRNQDPQDPDTSTVAADVWTDVLTIIEPQVPRHLFDQWWKDSVLVEDQGSVLVVRAKPGSVDHEVAAHWIQKFFAGVLAASLADVRPGARVEFRFAARPKPQERKVG